MDRRKLSLTLSEDDLRKNNISQNNSRRQTPVSRELRESSEERLRARIRQMLSEERSREYIPPPRPVVPITPMVVRRTPDIVTVARSHVPAFSLPPGREQVSSSPYRRVNNHQYFDWDNDETVKTNTSKPDTVDRRERWDDLVVHSKNNCEMCSMAKKAFEREQELKQKEKGNISRHCDDLRTFQEESNQ